jgi:ABC-2 type transport system permease protein
MTPPPTTAEAWVDALQRVPLTDADRAWLRAHLAAPGCRATARALEAATGRPIAEYRALAAALGAGVGALLRNQVAAVVGILVLIFVIDPILGGLVDGYAKYSLRGLGIALSGGSGDDSASGDLLAVWQAGLIWAGYTAVLVGAAALLTSRRDI